MRSKLLLTLFLGITSLAAAQQETVVPAASLPPLPPGPLIQKRAPEFSKWAIKVVTAPAKSKAGAGDAVGGKEGAPAWGSLVAMTKTGKIMLRQTTDDKKRVWNTWCMLDLAIQATVFPDEKSWTVESRAPNPNEAPTPNFEDYSQTDFPGFDWIAEKNYAGLKDVGGRKCILFQDSIRLLSDDPEPVAVAAYIDLETRLPVALNRGGEARSFEFLPAPQATLPLPPIVQELLDNRKKMVEAMTRRPSRSF